MRLASSTSCAAVSRSTLPMSFRKSWSESVVISRATGAGAFCAMVLRITATFGLADICSPVSEPAHREESRRPNANGPEKRVVATKRKEEASARSSTAKTLRLLAAGIRVQASVAPRLCHALDRMVEPSALIHGQLILTDRN